MPERCFKLDRHGRPPSPAAAHGRPVPVQCRLREAASTQWGQRRKLTPVGALQNRDMVPAQGPVIKVLQYVSAVTRELGSQCCVSGARTTAGVRKLCVLLPKRDRSFPPSAALRPPRRPPSLRRRCLSVCRASGCCRPHIHFLFLTDISPSRLRSFT